MTAEEIDARFVYEASDLGIRYDGRGLPSFKTWAPEADAVSLLLYEDHEAVRGEPSAVVPMERQAQGSWGVSAMDCSRYRYYRYRIQHGRQRSEVCDIWAYCAGADSRASQIVDIRRDPAAMPSPSQERYDGTVESYVNPWKGKRYADAVIYEMHVRDWSRVEAPDSAGRFLDIAEGHVVISYLKELGVTHVQLLPCFDYAQTNDDPSYNWGYNPYNYNVPEGRYVRNMREGTDAVRQFRALVQAFHQAGIAVIMDVVYNHTAGTGRDSLYDMTVPGYFYRLREDGGYSDGSGCGNEVATNHAMVKRFMIDSLRHWMLDYHVNGFRFDLMGCHEVATMRDVADALSAIDPQVMVYGEPWTGGASAVRDGVTKERIDDCCPDGTAEGVACFGDEFRDAVKGAEFLCFRTGQVQGSYADEAICRGLCGSAHLTRHLGRVINYAECHDNFTLFDKLALSALGRPDFRGDVRQELDGSQYHAVVRQDMLAAAYILLAQGTPFLNGGQEFLRSKRGDGNSYRSPDEVNQIDFSLVQQNRAVCDWYRGLIALRKAYPAAFGANPHAQAQCLAPGLTRYQTGNFVIYFNATDTMQTVDVSACTCRVAIDTGKVLRSSDVPPYVAAHSVLLLEKAD